MPKPSNYAILRDNRFERTIRQPEAIPFGRGVIDVNGAPLVRQPEGWRFADLETKEFFGEPISTLELAYPVRLLK